jgi:hypothetical protein
MTRMAAFLENAKAIDSQVAKVHATIGKNDV